MTKATLTAAVILAAHLATFSPARSDDDDTKPTVAAQFEAIRDEYDAADRACWEAQEEAKTPREKRLAFVKTVPNLVDYCRRMIDLAATAPKDPGARDALLWVLNHPGWSDEGLYGEEFGRAAERLVRDFGDDPEAIRIGLQLNNLFSSHRDQLLAGFVASAKGHEAKGLARLALGRYLQRKADYARGVRPLGDRYSQVHKGIIGDDGEPHDMTEVEPDERYAYRILLSSCDPYAIETQAEKLFEEVIRDYGDVPHITHRIRDLEASLEQPEPKWRGEVMTEAEVQKVRKIIETPHPSLAKAAEGHLDEMRNVIVGRTAPEIDGVDFAGHPLKLSDFRGKAVAIVFWGTWCGPCLREIPHERELVEKYKGRPFAMLGVDCRDSKEAAAKVMEAEGITWPNWHDGEDHCGPIASLYHVSGFPTVFVIDALGTIRSTNSRGEGLDTLVEKLVKEAEEMTPEK